ncbi:Fur family transcriptional regulator [Tepidibacter thalassicus]|uniref:Fur family transcriptional regulator, ferric uptake regulator n=1 Tax=Tepidibacter thalassicus DSM 15285 TaxID=1123350 RepID=A0A1M5PYP3_9FIRM|nr:Fur family transcriptional regulator [Tepidibacter thalassicus]SHH06840.1 Fur family transcriptional regulator, ferric uptake regulator [Tepidibacter thalassicus DSM 15285]
MDNYIEVVKNKLKEEGFKLTPQRRSIVDIMLKSKGQHLNSEEIYDLVKKQCPEIGLATVYRTLQLLDDIGAVSKLNLDDGCCRYELNINNESHNHHHLICKKCNKIIEVEEDLLDTLEEQIEKNYGFKIFDHDVKFFGLCSDCK